MADQSRWIVDATTATFQREVLERSLDVPVVVDFWAPWCGPCRQLAPVMEKLALEANGKFVLVKVNVEEAQEIAGMLGVQSIPLVVAFLGGRPVNQFMGALPEEQIRQWLDTFLPSPAQELLADGVTIEPTDPAGAETKYRAALLLEPDDDSIKTHLARVLFAQGKDDESRRIIAALEVRGFLEPEAATIKSQLELKTAAAEAGDVGDVRRAAEAAPGDLSLQLRLADALVAAGRHEEALEICLQVVGQDKAGVGVKAKETMVKLFDVLGPGSELTSTYRRRLATLLY